MALETWPYNYHAHSAFSDGAGTLREHVEQAERLGLRVVGMSDHAPLGDDIEWTMARERLEGYREGLAALREEFGGRLEVAIGVEADWYPERQQWLERLRTYSWDYTIISTHYVETEAGVWPVDESPEATETAVGALFGGSHRAACEAYFARHAEAAADGGFDILGHLDLVKKFNRDSRYFNEAEGWYHDAVERVLEAAARTNIIVEVNTAGLSKAVGAFYPSPWVLRRCLERGLRLTLNSDSHAPATLQYRFAETLPVLRDLGVRELWRWSQGTWSPEPIA